MSIDDRSEHVAPGRVVILSAEDAALFPLGTVVTARRRGGVYQASVPVTKPGDPPHVAHVFARPGETLAQLAARVRERFPPPPELEP